jgi:hypothetical protein
MKTLVATVMLCGLSASLQAQVPDFTPQTPLIGALLHNDIVAAKRLIDAGADPRDGQFSGVPTVFLAVMRQDVELLRSMVANGADPNARDRSGSTALMWAAFSEHGGAAMVEALLALGADIHAVNRAGESALTWALRRGDTPAVSVLRRAGASDVVHVKEATQKALALLQRSGAQFTKVSGCVSCHHHFLPQMALGVARTRGLAVDEPAVRQQMADAIAMLTPVYPQAVANRDRIPDPPISLSYTLIGLASAHYPADAVTDGLTRVIGAWQGEDGSFHTLPAMRPPIESSDVTATALSLRALQLYGSTPNGAVTAARRWLRGVHARNTEERAMQLLGLAWAKSPEKELRGFAKELLAEQRPDGGWAQLAGLETDAYATGQALVALEAAGHAVSSAEYQRGIGFLLRTQFPDGSWLVRSRSFPVQPPKDSGFPHGAHQWISAAGTSWASMALALSLPIEPPSDSATR